MIDIIIAFVSGLVVGDLLTFVFLAFFMGAFKNDEK